MWYKGAEITVRILILVWEEGIQIIHFIEVCRPTSLQQIQHIHIQTMCCRITETFNKIIKLIYNFSKEQNVLPEDDLRIETCRGILSVLIIFIVILFIKSSACSITVSNTTCYCNHTVLLLVFIYICSLVTFTSVTVVAQIFTNTCILQFIQYLYNIL